MKKLTLENFIERANKVHNNKYDYSKVVYKNCTTKVTVICPIHGEFTQEPHEHLRGNGCPECAKERGKENKRKKITKSFIQEAKSIHGDKYDYSEVNYVNSRTPVKIFCNGCKSFFYQIPSLHLIQRHCCPSCYSKIKGKATLKTTKEYIEEAKRVHGNKYDYSEVKYISGHHKVKIYCNTCKKFFYQEASSHLSGHGCPNCRKKEPHHRLYTLEKTKSIISKKFGTRFGLIDNTYKAFSERATIIDNDTGAVLNISPRNLCQRKITKYDIKYECQNLVKTWIIENGISYSEEVYIEDIKKKFGKTVKIDFIISYNNNQIWIEYNGKQHYKFNKYFHRGKPELFRKQVDRDNYVRKYCSESSIRFIEIPYIYNNETSIYNFLEKTIFNGIDPKSIVDYDSLYNS